MQESAISVKSWQSKIEGFVIKLFPSSENFDFPTSVIRLNENVYKPMRKCIWVKAKEAGQPAPVPNSG